MSTYLCAGALATSPLIQERPGALLEVTRKIIDAGALPRASDLFAAEYRLQALSKHCQRIIEDYHCLMTPTAGRHFTIDEIEEEPIARNSQLGYYTNYMNLLDLAGVALPTGFTDAGMPFGVTLVGEAFSDRRLLSIANLIQRGLNLPLGASKQTASQQPLSAADDPRYIEVVVCGAHMQGLPLNWQLTERGATLVSQTRTAPCYRLFALAGGPPLRPGLIRDDQRGLTIEAEIWRISSYEFGGFVAAIPKPLGIGKVEMADGKVRCGFICEGWGIDGAEEISSFGGWRAWLASRE